MKTDVTKQKYLRPAIAVFDMMEDKFRVSPKTQLQAYTLKRIIS